MIDVAANLGRVRERVAGAARRAGRKPEEITIVGVTKGLVAERALQGIRAGLADLGENYVQEALEKSAQLESEGVTWHFIGHLQRNKVKQALTMFRWVHSVDSLRLAEEISRRAVGMAKAGAGSPPEVAVLLEVNTSGEESKFGIAPEEAPLLAGGVGALPGVRLVGLMTIGRLAADPEEARPCFRRLRELARQIESLGLEGVQMTHLSMGMTGDFEVAVEEGATIVRIGTAIFGPRPAQKAAVDGEGSV
jgi:pyridoxal phosphate enzyme (YggS family)